MRRGGTPIDTASLCCVIPKPSMKSSIRISPGWMGSIRWSSVVFDEFDIFRTSISPDEADPRLRAHADAVLSAAVTHEKHQSAPGRDPKAVDALRCVDRLQLPHGRRAPHGALDALDVLLMPDAFGVLAAERPDQTTSYNDERQWRYTLNLNCTTVRHIEPSGTRHAAGR